MQRSLGSKVVVATKWSTVTQFVSKLIQPITTLVLAHILTPELFGVISLVTMVTSFGELFSDAGFQKYLIQHEYDTEKAMHQTANVAFWSNLAISIVIVSVIFLAKDNIASLLGDSTIGLAIWVSSISLILTAIISVQTGLYQRKLDFKTLFYSKTISSLVILIVAVPLALLGFGYWSMVIAIISSNLFLAVWLTLVSEWRPSLYYRWSILKEMFSFSVWSLLENILLWGTSWIGTLIISIFMNTYYVGLFNTTIAIVNGVLAVVTGIVKPITFSGLSRLQNSKENFKAAYLLFQKSLALIVVPLSFALLVFAEPLVEVFLGNSWSGASLLFGLYSFACAFTVVVGHISAEAYRAYGYPNVSLLTQVFCFLFVMFGILIGANSSFFILSISLPLARLIGYLVVHSLACKKYLDIGVIDSFKNLSSIYCCSVLISVISIALINIFSLSYLSQLLLCIADILSYLLLVLLIRGTRELLFELMTRFGFRRAVDRLSALLTK